MVETIIKSVINYVVPALLGFLIAILKNRKKKNDELNNTIKEELNLLKDANMIQLQSDLSSTYYFYESLHKWPDYICKNFLNKLKAYEKLGGNDYIHILAEHTKSWEIIRTDILNNK